MSLFRFMQDRRGGVAPIFAIAIIPVFGLVGAAVELVVETLYSDAEGERSIWRWKPVTEGASA